MDYESKAYRIAQSNAVIMANAPITIRRAKHFSIKSQNFVPCPLLSQIASKAQHRSMRIRQLKKIIKPEMEITLKISALIQKSPLL